MFLLFITLGRLPAASVSVKFDRTENEFAPILPKFSVINALSESVAVSIPTNDVIPMAMIRIVRDERRRVLLIERRETIRFSLIRGFIPNLRASSAFRPFILPGSCLIRL